jgi:glutamate/tyrosine decarboxylase-like PLP-dependent enzyme
MSDDFNIVAERAFRRARDHRARIETMPPRPTATLDSLRNDFDIPIPEHGRDRAEVIDQLADAAEPGLFGNTGPDFFGWVMGASDSAGVAADWLAAAWGQNAGIYQTAPAAAVAEEVAARWILELLDLPSESSLGFTTGATMASFISLAAARSEVLRRADWDLERDGLFDAPRIHVFVGADAHATIHSALCYLGFGQGNLIEVETDQDGRMNVRSLSTAMKSHKGPKIVICQAGQINTGAFDPLKEIASLCEANNAWLHVDGAFGLWARCVPSLRYLCDGVERADSWSVDGHKWLQVPYDSGFAIVKDQEAHRRAMDISASYLGAAPGDARNPSHYGPELSRRARGFAVWAVIQSLGRKGIEELVFHHCWCARHLRDYLANEPDIHVLNQVELNQLAISFGSDPSADQRNQNVKDVIAEIQRENTSFVAGAHWHGQDIMRISIISQLTDIEHVEKLGDSIIRAWRVVKANATEPKALDPVGSVSRTNHGQ